MIFKVWRLRFQSLTSLGLLTEAAHELEPFGEFDAPDLYFDYFPDLYPVERGEPGFPWPIHKIV